MEIKPFSIEVKVLANITYTTKMYAPSISDAKLYAEVMIMKSHYINWEEDIDEISSPSFNVKPFE